MTPNEFKIKYPEYSHLEGNDLWDTMEQVLLNCSSRLTADPNRIPVYHDPVSLPIVDENGVERMAIIQVEDEYATAWLDEDGNKVMLEKPVKINKNSATTSYRFVILDAQENR